MTPSRPVKDSKRPGQSKKAKRQLDQQTGPVIVPAEPEVDSVPLIQQVLEKFSDPSWGISLAVHLVLLLILAWCILPVVRRVPMVVLGETLPETAIQELEINPIQIENVDLELDPDLETEMDDLETVDDVELQQEFEQTTDSLDDFSSEFVEHHASKRLEEMADVESPSQVSTNPEAAKIQEQVVKAGGKNGEVQFSLVWKTITDLDLHVITPSGERVCYTNRMSRCKGNLDVDRNAKETTKTPVENVRWLKGKPHSGRYTVIVHMYRLRGLPGGVRYDLMAKTGDDIDLQKGKRIFLNDRLQVYRYIYFGPDVAESFRPEARRQLEALQVREEEEASAQLADVEPGHPQEDALLTKIVRRFPHTDAAIEALRRMSGRAMK